jgi:hypothetical protein
MRATLFTLLLSLAVLSSAALSQSPAEKTLFDLANQFRAENNLPPLAWDPALAKAAQAHLSVVLQHPGSLEHIYPGEPDLVTRGHQAGAHFSSIAENLAGGAQSAAQIHQSWVDSPGHRANLLGSGLTAIGIAVGVAPNGTLTAVEDFSHAAAVLSSAAIEQQVQKLFADRGIQPNTSAQAKQDARANCDTGATPQSSAANPPPILMMQWECTDLSVLPPELLQRLPPANPQKPQTAAVGACAPKQPQTGFTTYRLAVLIY